MKKTSFILIAIFILNLILPVMNNINNISFAMTSTEWEQYKTDKGLPPNTPQFSSNGYEFNTYYWETRGLMVYGGPSDVGGNEWKYSVYDETKKTYVEATADNPNATYEPRYLGFDKDGNKFTNMRFPVDSWSGKAYELKNWIYEPWFAPYYKDSNEWSRLENRDKYAPDINKMKDYLGWSPNNNQDDFFGYVYVQSYPTLTTEGSGRMWHQTSDGKVWYQTFPIPKLERKKEYLPLTVNTQITSNDFTIDENENTVTITVNVSAKLEDEAFYNTYEKVLYYNRDDIKEWQITLNYKDKTEAVTIPADGTNTANKSFNIVLSRDDIVNGESISFIGTVKLVYLNDINSQDADIDTATFTVNDPSPDLPIEVILSLPETANMNENYTVENKSIIPDGDNVTVNKLYGSTDGINYIEITNWNGTSIIENKNYEGTLWYKLYIETDTGKTGTDIKSINIIDNTPTGVIADISAPSSAYEGHEFTIKNNSKVIYGDTVYTFKDAYDLGLATYSWNKGGASGSLDVEGGKLTKTLSSDVSITFTGKDKNNIADSVTKVVRILPCPRSQIEISGYLKENRKVTIKSNPIVHPNYPIVSTTITVEPVSSGLTQNDIKKSSASTDTEAYYIFKKAGDYKAIITVQDSRGNTDTREEIFTIEEDKEPIADINSSLIKIRDPSNSNKTTFTAYDKMSRSIDFDSIKNRIWGYRYDSDNDGSFDDETYVKIDDTNKNQIDYIFDKVGRYELILDVVENFGSIINPQPTLSEFITENDYKTGRNSIIVEVDNVAPTAMLDTQKRKNINLKLVIGSSSIKDDIKNNIDSLTNKLISKGFNPNINTVELTPDYDISRFRYFLYKDLILDYNLNDDKGYVTDETDFNYYATYTDYNSINYYSTVGIRDAVPLVDENNILYYLGYIRDNNCRYYTYMFAYDLNSKQPLWQSNATVVNGTSYPNFYLKDSPDTGIYESKSDKNYIYFYRGYIYKVNKYTGEIVDYVTSSDPNYSTVYNDLDMNLYSDKVSNFTMVQNFSVNKNNTDWSYTDAYNYKYHITTSYNATFKQFNINLTITKPDGSTYNVFENGYRLSASDNYNTAGARFKLFYYNNKPVMTFTIGGKETRYNGKPFVRAIFMYGNEIIDVESKRSNSNTHYSPKGPEIFFTKFKDKIGIYSHNPNLHYYAHTNVSTVNYILQKIKDELYKDELYNTNLYPNIRNDFVVTDEAFSYETPRFITKEGNVGILRMVYMDSNGNAYPTYKSNTKQTIGIEIHEANTQDQRDFITVQNLIDETILDENSDKNYIIYLNDKNLSDYANVQSLINHANNNNNSFISISNSNHQTQAQYIANNTNGLYIDDSNSVDNIFTQIADFIDTQLEDNSTGEQIILVGDTIDYTTSYFDYENDPIVSSRWKYIHDPTVFDNNNGYASFNNTYRTSPVTDFGNKVGKYQVIYQVKDDPPGNYPGDWSDEGNYYLYVHRKPVAIVNLDVLSSANKNGDGTYKKNATLIIDTSSSYDPDMQYRDSDKGIAGFKVVYKHENDSIYTTDFDKKYIVLDKEGIWDFKIQVQDKMGAWSDVVTKTVTVSGIGTLQRSISASFKIPDNMYVGQAVKDIGKTVETINCSLSSETIDIRKLGQSSWNSVNTTTFFNENYVINDVGTYEIRYRAYNNYGEYAESIQTIQVNEVIIDADIFITGSQKVNRKVSFEVKESSTNQHPITRTEWTFEAVSGNAQSSSIKVKNLNMLSKDALFKTDGVYKVKVKLFTEINSVEYMKILEETFTINLDLEPTGSILSNDKIYRNSNGIANLDVELQLNTEDYIDNIKYYLIYDSDNDNDFNDESQVELTEYENLYNFNLELSNGVGKYKLKAIAKEGFLEDTITEFIAPEDYLTTTIEKIIEVDNLMPLVDFTLNKDVYLVGETIEYYSPSGERIVTQSDYNYLFTDDEKDNIYSFKWKVEHNPNIMPNPDTLSSYNNVEQSNIFTTFDKAGEYTISAYAEDEPARNILINDDYEDGLNGYGTWVAYGNTINPTVIDFNNNKVLKLEASPSGTSLVSKSLYLEKGQTYKYKYRIYFEEAADSYNGIYWVNYYTNDTNPDHQVYHVPNLADTSKIGQWQTIEGSITIPNDSEYNYTVILLRGHSSSKSFKFYIDDFMLYQVADSYKKQSNIAIKKITVHRPPEAKLNFTAISNSYYTDPANYDFGNLTYLEGTTIRVNDLSTDPDGYSVNSTIQYKKESDTNYTTINSRDTITIGAENTIFKVTTTDNYGAIDTKIYIIKGLHELNMVPDIIPKPVSVGSNITLKLTTNKYATNARCVVFGNNVPLNLINETATEKFWEAQYTIPLSTSVGTYTAQFYATSESIGELRADKDFDVIKNRPPTVAITNINPSFIYEGDNVSVTIQPNDPDLEPLNLDLELYKDSNLIYNNSKVINPNGSIYDLLTESLINDIETGTYQVVVKVTDGYGETATDNFNFTVNELSINGYVSHTTLWDQHRIEFNQAKTGTNDSPRDYDTYWSGEKFILSANTTNIDPQSSVIASSVNVQILGTSYSTNLTSSDNINWTGELWEESMLDKWGNNSIEYLTFRFTVYYNNGTIKMNDVIVKIDNTESYWRLHKEF